MTARRTTLLTGAAAAVALGFAVGSVATPATAGAARLTKGKVEKIAAAVVDQKAASLRVSHATTADRAVTADQATTAVTATTASSAGDSAKLGGKAPDAYGTWVASVSGAQLRTGATGRVTSRTWTITGLEDGGYLAFYDLALEKSSPDVVVSCWLGFSEPVTIGASVGMGSTTSTVISGNAPVQQFSDNAHGVPTTHKVQLGCEATGGTFTIANPKQSTMQSTVTLLRTDTGPATPPGVVVAPTDQPG